MILFGDVCEKVEGVRIRNGAEVHEALTMQGSVTKPRGLMDKASAYGAEDWGFESLRGCLFYC